MSEGSQRPSWTFLTNHAHVLVCVALEPEVRVRDVAERVGVTERCVQRMLADLEQAGYISRVHHGRRNHYEVHPDVPLRHPLERHVKVEALLKAVLGTATSADDARAEQAPAEAPSADATQQA